MAKLPASYHLAVDARAFGGHPNGYTTYLTSIIRPLLKKNWRVTLLTNRPLNPLHKIVGDCKVAQFGPSGATKWEQQALPRYLEAHQFDVYFAGTNRGIPWRRPTHTRTVLALLDIIPYKLPQKYFLAGKFHFLRHELLAQLSAVWRADAIVTISQSSADDIRHFFRRQNVTPLLLSLSPVETPARTDLREQLVYVGGVDPRKRVDNLVRAFAIFRHQHPTFKLVLIGGGYEVLQPLIDKLGLTKIVIMPGYISDHEKFKTIAASVAMIYPSLYEGYGLAIAEGLQANIPVVAGAGGAQREVGGDAAVYIDPNDPVDIDRGMELVLDPMVQKRLAEARTQQLTIITDPDIDRRVVRYFEQQGELARGGRGKPQ